MLPSCASAPLIHGSTHASILQALLAAHTATRHPPPPAAGMSPPAPAKEQPTIKEIKWHHHHYHTSCGDYDVIEPVVHEYAAAEAPAQLRPTAPLPGRFSLVPSPWVLAALALALVVALARLLCARAAHLSTATQAGPKVGKAEEQARQEQRPARQPPAMRARRRRAGASPGARAAGRQHESGGEAAGGAT